MFKKIFINMFLLFILFQNIFRMPNIMNYWDEVIEILIIFLGVLKIIKFKKIDKNIAKIIILLLILIVIGLLGNIIFEYVTNFNYILRDMIVFIKFPITLTFLIYLGADKILKDNLSQKTISIIKIMLVIMTICGIISIVKDIGMSQTEIRYGIHPYMFLFTHPTYLVFSCFMILAILESTETKNKNFYIILITILIILSMRTKGIVTIALYYYVKMFGKLIKKYKIISMISLGVITVATAWKKLLLYKSFSTSPREVFYKGSITLIKKCFPIGSGFASYSSHISYAANSKVYNFISLTHLLEFSTPAIFGDAGYSYYIGQFGIIGIVLFIIIGTNLYKILKENNKDNNNATILVFLYILIALTSETTLANFGVELAVILAITRLNSKEG